MEEVGVHLMDIRVVDLHMVVGEEVEVEDRGIREDLEVHAVHFPHTVILVDQEWDSMAGRGSRVGQGFRVGVGEGGQCRGTMSLGYLGRRKVLLGRKIWRKEGLVMGRETVRWELIRWVEEEEWGIVGTNPSHPLVMGSLGGEVLGQPCQVDHTQALTPYLHS